MVASVDGLKPFWQPAFLENKFSSSSSSSSEGVRRGGVVSVFRNSQFQPSQYSSILAVDESVQFR